MARSRYALALVGAGVVLVLAGTFWMARPPLTGTAATSSRGAGLAPPGAADLVDGARQHGTVPLPELEPDRADGRGRRAEPLPLDAEIPVTRDTWPNIRVDQAVQTPEETAIIIHPQDPNRIVAVAQAPGCYYFYSADGGLTWDEGSLTDPYDLGDPSITVDAQGVAYYGYIGTFSHSGIFVARSFDGGASWQPSTPVIEHSTGRPFEDKEWPTCDLTSGPYAGSLYIAWTQFDRYGSSSPYDSTRILFSYSRDQATSFAPPVRVSDRGGNCIDGDDTVEGAVPAVGADGTVYLAWAGPRGIEFDRSHDGGVTWGADQVISDIPGGWDFSVPGIFRCNGLPSTWSDTSGGPYTGRVYVLWSDQRHGDTDVFLLHSDDGGLTWSPRTRVNGDPIGNGRHQFFPWMAIDPENGHFYVVFYDRRATTGNDTEVWMAISRDGGATFAEEVISQSPFTPDAGVFFGDYIGIAARNGRVRPFWMRLDSAQLSVWTALIDIDLAEVRSTPARMRLTVLPNPTRTEARIFAWGGQETAGAEASEVRIYGADGRLVRSFSSAQASRTGLPISWDLRDLEGRRVPAGSYWVRSSQGATARLIVTR